MPFEELPPHNSLTALPALPAGHPRRRVFLQQSTSCMGLVAAAGLGAPALVLAQSVRPQLPDGLQLGDTTIVPAGRRGFDEDDVMDYEDADRSGGPGLHARSIVWARGDKPARMVLEWDQRSFCQPAKNHQPVCAGGNRLHRSGGFD